MNLGLSPWELLETVRAAFAASHCGLMQEDYHQSIAPLPSGL